MQVEMDHLEGGVPSVTPVYYALATICSSLLPDPVYRDPILPRQLFLQRQYLNDLQLRSLLSPR